AEFDDVGACLGQRLDDIERGREIGIAGHHIGDEGRAPRFLELSETGVDTRGHLVLPFRMSPTCGTSLSPRPERLTTIRWSFGRFGASSITLAMACAGSSAGMMPSSFDSSWNAASASSSVAERYVTRPVSCSQECSGPIPG